MNILTVTSASQMFLVGVLCILLLAWLMVFAWLALRRSPRPISLQEDASPSRYISTPETSIVRHAINSVHTHTPTMTPGVKKEAVLESSLR